MDLVVGKHFERCNLKVKVISSIVRNFDVGLHCCIVRKPRLRISESHTPDFSQKLPFPCIFTQNGTRIVN